MCAKLRDYSTFTLHIGWQDGRPPERPAVLRSHGSALVVQIDKLLEAEIVLHDILRRLDADIAEVPRLVDAGY